MTASWSVQPRLTAAPRVPGWAAPALIALTTVLMGAWFFWNVSRYAVNILFWDLWGFWKTFDDKGVVYLFWHRDGPQLGGQGLGTVLSGTLARFTGWNTRAECFLIAGLVLVALLTALALRRAIFGRWEWTDIIWPVLFLSPLMVDVVTTVPDMSHGIMPLLLLLLFCLSWGIKRRGIAYLLMLLIAFNCTYTGFGVFLGIVAPGLLLLEAVAFWRGGNFAAMRLAIFTLLGSIASLLVFIHGFTLTPGVEGFKFPDPHWYLYPKFIALQLAYAAGVRGGGIVPMIAGFSSMVIVMVVLVIHVRRVLRPRAAGSEAPRGLFLSQVIVTLLAFGITYSCFCAVGRLVLGVTAGQSARYIPLLMGMVLAVYFHVVSLPRGTLRGVLLLWMVATLIPGHGWMRNGQRWVLEYYANGKRAWKGAYLASGSIEEADRAANFEVYPNSKAKNLQGKLDELRRRHLNLFLDAPPATSASARSP